MSFLNSQSSDSYTRGFDANWFRSYSRDTRPSFRSKSNKIYDSNISMPTRTNSRRSDWVSSDKDSATSNMLKTRSHGKVTLRINDEGETYFMSRGNRYLYDEQHHKYFLDSRHIIEAGHSTTSPDSSDSSDRASRLGTAPLESPESLLKPFEMLMSELGVSHSVGEENRVLFLYPGVQIPKEITFSSHNRKQDFTDRVTTLLKEVVWASLSVEEHNLMRVTGASLELIDGRIGYSLGQSRVLFESAYSVDLSGLKPEYDSRLAAAQSNGYTVKVDNHGVRLFKRGVPKAEVVRWESVPQRFTDFLQSAETFNQSVTHKLEQDRHALESVGFDYRWERGHVVFTQKGREVSRIEPRKVAAYLESLTSKKALLKRLDDIVSDYFLPLKDKLTVDIQGEDVVFTCKSTIQADHHHHHHHHHDHHSHCSSGGACSGHASGGVMYCGDVSLDETGIRDEGTEIETGLHGDIHIFKVKVSELMPLVKKDIVDGIQSPEAGTAKLKLVSLLAPHTIKEFTEESSRWPVPSDGYDEAALLFKSSGISDLFLWSINLGIFAGGTYALCKYGIGHVIEHMKELSHEKSHLREKISELTTKKGSLESRSNRAAHAERILQLEAEITQKREELARKVEDYNDHIVEFCSLSFMAGGTFFGVVESGALAFKTLGTGTTATNAAAVMAVSELASHIALGLGSVLSIYTGFKASKASVTTLEDTHKAVNQLKESQREIRKELTQLTQKMTTLRRDSEEAEALQKQREQMEMLIEIFDHAVTYTQDEGDFKSAALKTRGRMLMAGGALLGAFNAGHVLIDLGWATAASGIFEGPIGLAAMAIGVSMVIVGVATSLILEFREGNQSVLEHAGKQIKHDFDRQIEFMKGLLQASGVQDTDLFKEYAESYILRARRKADEAWVLRKEVQSQIGHARGRYEQKSVSEIQSYVKQEADISHYEVKRLIFGQIQPGILSMKGLGLASGNTPLVIKRGDNDVMIWSRYLARLKGGSFDDTSVDMSRKNLEKLIKDIVVHLKDTGVLDQTIYGVAHFSRSLNVVGALDRMGMYNRTFSAGLRDRLNESGFIKHERLKTEDKRHWVTKPLIGFAKLGNACATAADYMWYGAKSACRIKTKQPGWSQRYNDTDRKLAKVVSYYDIGEVLTRLDSNPDSISDSDLSDVLEALKISYFSSNSVDLMQRGFCLSSRQMALDVESSLL